MFTGTSTLSTLLPRVKLVVALDDTLGLRLDLAAAAAIASSGGKEVWRSGCEDLGAAKEFLREAEADPGAGEPIFAFLFGWKFVEIEGEPGGSVEMRLLFGGGFEEDEDGGEDADGSGDAMDPLSVALAEAKCGPSVEENYGGWGDVMMKAENDDLCNAKCFCVD